VRGQSLSRANRKLDTVVVAARYAPHDGRLTQVRAFERRGAVWTDWLILDRTALLQRLEAGKRVVTGIPRDLPGDFRVLNQVRRDGQAWLVAGGNAAGRDDLGLPLF
jgi:hypothetical protein